MIDRSRYHQRLKEYVSRNIKNKKVLKKNNFYDKYKYYTQVFSNNSGIENEENKINKKVSLKK